MEMAKVNLASMSVDALLKLRDDIEKALSRNIATSRATGGQEEGHSRSGCERS
jgi:hypothetical protein